MLRLPGRQHPHSSLPVEGKRLTGVKVVGADHDNDNDSRVLPGKTSKRCILLAAKGAVLEKKTPL